MFYFAIATLTVFEGLVNAGVLLWTYWTRKEKVIAKYQEEFVNKPVSAYLYTYLGLALLASALALWWVVLLNVFVAIAALVSHTLIQTKRTILEEGSA